MTKAKFKIPAPTRNLVYTIALDVKDSQAHRMMSKLLASSLLRTYFNGDIVIFRNSERPLFQVERAGLREVQIDTKDFGGVKDQENAWRYKFRVRHLLDTEDYDKVLFLDADCLALRNLDHLLEGNWDIGWYPEPGRSITFPQFHCFLTDTEMKLLTSRQGANSGSVAVRGSRFQEVMAEWERIDLGPTERSRTCSDQASWNRLLLDTKLRKHPFERGEIQFPLFLQPNYHEWKNAALIHAIGGATRDKMKFLFGVYMQTFYFDDSGSMLNMLEI